MTMQTPSTALLRVFLRPSTVPCCQIRHATSWMPRERYKHKTRLDVLHRKQKADKRAEHARSAKRAQSMLPPSLAGIPPVEPTQTSELIAQTTTHSVSESSTHMTEQTSSEPTSTTPQTDPSQNSTSAAIPPLRILPYHISRTRTSNIPVYESFKAGGNKHITTIRKCAGDLDLLQKHILEALKMEPSFVDPRGQKKHNVVVNRLTNHVVIRGWRGPEVRKWCEMAGF